MSDFSVNFKESGDGLNLTFSETSSASAGGVDATARAEASKNKAAIAQEKTQREAADTALGTRITNEVAARKAADDALGTRIDNLPSGGSTTPLSDSAPTRPNDNSGAAGSSTSASRSDHKHPLPAHATPTSSGLMSSQDKAALDQAREDIHELDLLTEDIKIEEHSQWSDVSDPTNGAFAVSPLSGTPTTYVVSQTPTTTILQARLRIPLAAKLNGFQLIQGTTVLTPTLWSESAPDTQFRYFDALGFRAQNTSQPIRIQRTTRTSHSNVYTRESLLFNSNEFDPEYDPVTNTSRLTLKNEYALPSTRSNSQIPVWDEATKQWVSKDQLSPSPSYADVVVSPSYWLKANNDARTYQFNFDSNALAQPNAAKYSVEVRGVGSGVLKAIDTSVHVYPLQINATNAELINFNLGSDQTVSYVSKIFDTDDNEIWTSRGVLRVVSSVPSPTPTTQKQKYINTRDAKSIAFGRTAAAYQAGGRIYVGSPRSGPSQTLTYSSLNNTVVDANPGGPSDSGLYFTELNLITSTEERNALNGTHFTVSNTGSSTINVVAINNLDVSDNHAPSIAPNTCAVFFLFASDTPFSTGRNFKLLGFRSASLNQTFYLTEAPGTDLGIGGDVALVRENETTVALYRHNGSSPPANPWQLFVRLDSGPTKPTAEGTYNLSVDSDGTASYTEASSANAPVEKIYGTSQRLETSIDYEARIKFRQTNRELTSTDLSQIGSGLQLQAIAVDHTSDTEDVYVFDLSSKNIAAFRDGVRTSSLDINPVNSSIAAQNGAPDITSMSFGYGGAGLTEFENTLFTVDTDLQEAIGYKKQTDGSWAYDASLTVGLRNAQLTALDSAFNPSAIGFLLYQGEAYIRVANSSNRVVYQWRWNPATSTWDRDAGDDIAASRFGSERPWALSYDGVFVATASSATASPQVRNQPATKTDILLPRPFLQRLSTGLQITDMDGSLTNRLYFLDGPANHVYAFWPSDLLEVDKNSLQGILVSPPELKTAFASEPTLIGKGNYDVTTGGHYATEANSPDITIPEDGKWAMVNFGTIRSGVTSSSGGWHTINLDDLRTKVTSYGVRTNISLWFSDSISVGHDVFLGVTSERKLLFGSSNSESDSYPLEIRMLF